MTSYDKRCEEQAKKATDTLAKIERISPAADTFLVLMINPQTGDAVRVTSKREYLDFKDADWKPVALKFAAGKE